MKKRWYFETLALLLLVMACQEKDLYEGPKEPEKVYNTFGFSTVAEGLSLEVNYKNGGIPASVYFEVYGEMPVKEINGRYVKCEDVVPFFAACTDSRGAFSGNVDLPAYLKKVYLYSPDFQAQTLIEAEVKEGRIVASDDTDSRAASRTVTATGKEYDSYMLVDLNNAPNEYKDVRWKDWLGEYDKKRNGEIAYKYTGTDLKVTNYSELYSVHNQVINTKKSCPEEYRSYTDLYIQKEAEMAVTFLGQNTCWNCSLGYYYYKEGEKPNSLDEAHVIMLFPNTQDGEWSNGRDAARMTAGIDRGTAVQLKYYPNIASGSKEGETTIFPVGYRIGFVLANNAWGNRVSTYNTHKKYRAATSEGLSVNNNGVAYSSPRTAAYKYGDYVMISFEDHVDDDNFCDVVITMKSNPVEAITDIPEVDPENKRTKTTLLKGMYAFEDLWPAKGDYDLNDVLVRYGYEKEFDRDNKIYSEAFTFKTFQNYVTLNSGLAVKISPSKSPEKVEYAVRRPGETEFTEAQFTYESEEQVYLLAENIKAEIGSEYRVKFIYNEKSPAKAETKQVLPFIYRNTDGDHRLEVHIAQEAPTGKADKSLFGTKDDASVPSKGIYYVRDGIYPFAFFLSGADETDLAPLLDRANESIEIGTLYPQYGEWVKSNGEKYKDWYKN